MFSFLVEQELALSMIGKDIQMIENPEIIGVCTKISGGLVYMDGHNTHLEMRYFRVVVTELQEGEVLSPES
jgi:hypothetical protein